MRSTPASRASAAVAANVHRQARRIPTTAALLVCLGAGPVASLPLQAQTLPGASSNTACAVTGAPNLVDPRSCATSNDHAQVVLAPAPTLSAAADFPGSLAQVNAGANALLIYSFAVLGGAAGDRVHLDAATLLHWATAGSINANAFSRVIVTTSLGEVTANICSYNCGAGSGVTDFNGTLHVDAVSGVINTVYMDVYANAAYSQNANSASVFADPVLSIDPLTPNAGAFWLVFSDGIGNAVPAVPEPANWVLMLAGFGVVGVSLGRRRKTVIAG